MKLQRRTFILEKVLLGSLRIKHIAEFKAATSSSLSKKEREERLLRVEFVAIFGVGYLDRIFYLVCGDDHIFVKFTLMLRPYSGNYPDAHDQLTVVVVVVVVEFRDRMTERGKMQTNRWN